ncbi:ATPase AAA-type core domain-containing protein [Entamoeba marina]
MQSSTKILTAFKQLSQHNSEKSEVIGRENEIMELLSLIPQFQVHKHFGCVLIHGGSGIGKTTIVKHVINSQQFKHSFRKVPQTCYVNVLQSESEKEIINTLCEKFTKNSEHNFFNLTDKLEQSDRMNIIVFDEIDCLSQKSRKLFNWIKGLLIGNRTTQNLVVVGISNETDAFFKMHDDIGRAQYCCSCLYSPYSKTEIANIIRNSCSGAFEEKAIDFIATTTLSKESDIRYAYKLSLEALQIARQFKSPIVKMLHVIKAKSSLSGDNEMKNLFSVIPKRCQEVCLALLFIGNNNQNLISTKLWYQQYCNVSKRVGLFSQPGTSKEFYGAISMLISQGIVSRQRATQFDTGFISHVVANYDKSQLVSVLEKIPPFRPLVEGYKASACC